MKRLLLTVMDCRIWISRERTSPLSQYRLFSMAPISNTGLRTVLETPDLPVICYMSCWIRVSIQTLVGFLDDLVNGLCLPSNACRRHSIQESWGRLSGRYSLWAPGTTQPCGCFRTGLLLTVLIYQIFHSLILSLLFTKVGGKTFLPCDWRTRFVLKFSLTDYLQTHASSSVPTLFCLSTVFYGKQCLISTRSIFGNINRDINQQLSASDFILSQGL